MPGATLNVTGTLSGGSVLLVPGATLSGSGTVNSSISGFINSSIVATGNLSLGDRTSYTGFNHAGTLAVGANSVTLNSAGFANLGILTTLSGGTLSAPNGVSLGVGCNLSGSGAVNGKSRRRLWLDDQRHRKPDPGRQHEVRRLCQRR